MGWPDCFVKQRLESCRLYCKLTNTADNRLIKSIFKWSKRFMNFVGDAGLANLFETESVNTEYVIKQCKSKLIEMDRNGILTCLMILDMLTAINYELTGYKRLL